MITVRRFPVKREAPVDLKEMKMGADLNGAVAGVTDFEGDGFAPRIEFNGIGTKDQAADRGSAVRRKQASKRLAHDGYTQIALKALPGNQEAEQEQLFRRIRGWLEKQ